MPSRVTDTEYRRVANLVKAAISDEWLAAYQYWIGSVILVENYPNVVSQFREHMNDEFKHATALALWLKDFSGAKSVPMSIDEIPKTPYCGYIYPHGNIARALVTDAIEGEQCAIKFYETFIDILNRRFDLSSSKFSDLHAILSRALDKEKEHLKDLQTLIKYNFDYGFFFT